MPDFRKTCPDARTGAEKEDASGETRTYGNPRSVKSRLGQRVQFMVRDGVETAGNLSFRFRVQAGPVVK